MQNPFTLTFGKAPFESIERPEFYNEIVDAFKSDVLSLQTYIITGIRGSGKTVLMSQIAEKFKAEKDWIVVELNPETDMLLALAAKLSSENKLAALFRNAKLNLSFFGIGLDISGEAKIVDIGVALRKMIETVARSGKRILITIDEATNSKYMREFTSEFQILVRNNLPVCLLMTGLYKNVSSLQDEPDLTFLYRAPKVQLGALSRTAIMLSYEKIFSVSHEDARNMAELTKGYPFAFQTLGYLSWNNRGKYKEILPLYRQYLEEYSYEKIWSELSTTDREVAFAIAKSETSKVAEIRALLGMDLNHFSPYRKRLLRAGIVDGSEYGKLRFTLPFFAEFVIESQ